MVPKPKTDLSSLLETVASENKTIQAYLATRDCSLSFDEDGPARLPADLPDEFWEARTRALEAINNYQALLYGPADHLKWLASSMQTAFVLQWLTHFDIAAYVPLNDSITYDALSQRAGVRIDILQRILRRAMLDQIFIERAGQVAHSASSLLLASKTSVRALIRILIGNGPTAFFPALAHTVAAQEQSCFSTDPIHSGWNLANKISNDTYYTYLAKLATESGAEFSLCMEEGQQSYCWSVTHLFRSYDWESLPSNTTVVDVGGGSGSMSIALAQRFPHLKFIVQDLGYAVEQGASNLPEELHDRIKFQVHDFFDPQPVNDADIYFLQDVLIDHSDEKAQLILTHLANAMKHDAKILVREGVLPEPGTCSPTDELSVRSLDLVAMAVRNTGHRDIRSWRQIFESGHAKLRMVETSRPSGSIFSLMTLQLEQNS